MTEADLTKFQEHILRVLVDNGEMYGLGLKTELEDYYGEEINHGRLYPNLDRLVENGYLTKRELDRRTNGYSPTEKGYEVVSSIGNRFRDAANNYYERQ